MAKPKEASHNGNSALPLREAYAHFCAKPCVLYEASAHVAWHVQLARVFIGKAHRGAYFLVFAEAKRLRPKLPRARVARFLMF